MLHTPSGFVCICPPKSVELGGDGGLHRADHQPELHAELEFTAAGDTGSTYAYRPGGGVRAINPSSSMTLAESETCIAVFKGCLANKAELAMTLTGCKPGMKDAEVLIHMYERYGVDMLGRLDGAFAFLLYDARQARVLAARDPSGGIPLVQGRTAGGSLLIACGTYMPEGMHDVEEIHPGEFKYGWHAVPRHYLVGSPRQVDTRRASLDHGIRRRSLDVAKAAAAVPSAPHPTDVPHMQPYQQHRRHSSGTDDRRGHHSNGTSNGMGLNGKAAPYQHPHLTEQLLHRASAAAPRRSSEDGAMTGSTGHEAGRGHTQQQWLRKETVLAPVAEEQWRQQRRAKAHQQQQQAAKQQGQVAKAHQPQAPRPQHHHQQQQAKQQQGQQAKQELRRQSSEDGSYSTLEDDHSANGAAAAGENGQATNRRRRHRRKPRSGKKDGSTDTDSQGGRSEAAAEAAAEGAATAALAGVALKAQAGAGVGAPALMAARSLGSFGPRRNGSCGDLMALSGSPVLVPAMQGLAC